MSTPIFDTLCDAVKGMTVTELRATADGYRAVVKRDGMTMQIDIQDLRRPNVLGDREIDTDWRNELTTDWTGPVEPETEEDVNDRLGDR